LERIPPEKKPLGTESPPPIRRGKQAEIPLNAAIVGGGKACYDLLQLLDRDRLSRLKMKILGVSDVDPDAPGLRYAKRSGLLATTRMEELFGLEGLNLVIELTGSPKVRDEIYRQKPADVSVIDHRAIRLIWDLIQIEMERTALERDRHFYEEQSRKGSIRPFSRNTTSPMKRSSESHATRFDTVWTGRVRKWAGNVS